MKNLGIEPSLLQEAKSQIKEIFKTLILHL